ncbi:hypothetical protein N0V93_003332 [Gnomoniopsis smithogilvyi]|uniref:Uncharacterized protein n=1 Tax=Gnomoniopsis smithogilvyi TaxID=1191159 RepID=A0A9W8Z0J2_9PEZI|nr:hypothetical protein N0V93_003332 [Gnomoniopsis smithogilvyi]
MSSTEPVEKTRASEHGQSSMTGFDAEETLMGDAFPDSSTLREYAATEPCITFPLGDLNDRQLTSPLHTNAFSCNPTPRPHLFPSLEAARDHVYRKSSDTRQASRDASGEVFQASSEDDPSLGEMKPLPSIRAFNCSSTSCAQPQAPALSALRNSPVRDFTPTEKSVFWEDVPKPLNTSSSRDVSSSQMSGNSVDRIVGQYGRLSSSTAQGQAAVYGSSSPVAELDRFIGQDRDDVRLTADTEPFGRDGAMLAHEGDFRLNSKVFDQSTSPGPSASEAPLHPSNPFFNSSFLDGRDVHVPDLWSQICPAGPDSLLRMTPTPPMDHSRAKLGRELGAESFTGSETVSIAESKVGPLSRPSDAMHSVRCQRRGRHNSQNEDTHSAGVTSQCTDASDADEDPFEYDRRGPFLQPSKERVVSANLQKVSGLPRESTATVYSQDGTPSRTFYGETAADYFDQNGKPLSPGPGRKVNDVSLKQAPPRNPFVALSRNHHDSANVTKGFYDPDAINPDWASGGPDVVRVPVTNKGNLFGPEPRGPRRGPNLKPEQEVGLEALRRREGDNRITGNTED